MKWQDAEDIGIALVGEVSRRRSADGSLHRSARARHRASTSFDDDPKTSNEPKLEAIQMAWHEEFKDAQ